MHGGSNRPHFNKGIAQLEALFQQSQQDIKVLQTLAQELNQRTTERAIKLRLSVVERLQNLADEPTRAVPDQRAASPVLDTKAKPVPPSAPMSPAPLRPPEVRPLPSIEDLGPLPSFSKPKTDNEPAAIIAAWTALEALSPQTYRRPEDLAAGDRRCVADFSNGQVPWGINERSRPKRQLYYQIILGSIPMAPATEQLVKAFGEDEERAQRAREKAAMAAVLVDKNGIVVEENGIAVSSFAWALPLALKLKLDALGAWPRIEPKIIEKLDAILRRVDSDGNPLPLDIPIIHRAHEWLVAQFGLPAALVEAPSFALRGYHYFKAKNPPEVSLLNSFFLGDLARASALFGKNAAPPGLRGYLGLDKPVQIEDLLDDKVALEKITAPAMTPAARWPAPGGFPLVMLQQAAVNVARSELCTEGIVAVNGPPGTGKTTLLRDIVAACVLDRALAMAAFDDPERAFTPSGEKVAAGEKAFFQLYRLDERLKGHEILVASSNNKAVENVSKELPATKAIGRTCQLTYFKSISDCIHSRAEPPDEESVDAVTPEPIDTWGLIAAVLGNAKNRSAFQQSFWWHDDFGFRLYLKAAKGDSVVREIRDPETGRILERRTPLVIAAENPPTPQVAKSNWQKARAQLLRQKKEVDAELKALEEVRSLCLELPPARQALEKAEAARKILLNQRPALENAASEHGAAFNSARIEHDRSSTAAHSHRRSRPGFLSRLFRTERWKAWGRSNEPLEEAERATHRHRQTCERALAEANLSLKALTDSITNAETAVAASRGRVEQLRRAIEAYRPALGERLMDDSFFGHGHKAWNLASPWLPDSLHRKREDLFMAALAVHRAFIDAAAQKVLHNLSVLMDVFASGAPQDEKKRQLLGDLWSTLFLVVPVLSTTFASVDRMLGDLPSGSLGWLLIDEAGQALPQAAIGAIMRAKRSLVVGDPLQIPPVVSLPERLNSEICAFFRVSKPLWAAPEASAQTLADRASRFQAAFRSDQGPRKVGVPLLVHRRCQEPMFGISNRIAYDGQMVHAAKPDKDGLIGRVLGTSLWFDINGEADSKWCPAEGEAVMILLRKIAAAGIVDPDLFLITPFRIVAQEMRRRLEREAALFSALRVEANEWVNDRVGTIHTVQGREAEAVILILGAPKAAQNGARSWAAGTPNILNVAVSRAKQNLYVVGSHGAWSGVGHARELAGALQRVRL